MSVKESLRRGVAGAGVAGVLSVSMLMGQAAPAQAILPIVPVVIGAVGATGTGAAISGWAMAGYAALSLGVLGVATAIKDNGHVIFQDALKFLEPKPAAQPESFPAFTEPGTGPGDGAYLWSNSRVSLKLPGVTSERFEYTAGKPVNRINMTFVLAISTTPAAEVVRFMYVMENTCKRPDGTTYSEARYIQEGIMQGAAGYNELPISRSCAFAASGHDLMVSRIRPATTFEKIDPAKFNHPTSETKYSEYTGPGQEILWKAPNFAFAEPGYRATVECVSKDGVKTKLEAYSAYNIEGKVTIPSCAAAGLGDVAASLAIDLVDGTRTVQPAYRTIPKPDQFLECDAAFGNVCKLEIYIDGLPCVVGTVQCAGWVSQHQANPSRVKCFYGSREVSISNCGVLEGAYAYGGSPMTGNNTDGDPNTWDDPQKVPGWTPQPGPNGEPVSNPDPTVEPNPDNNPNVDPTPDPGPSPSPGTEPSTNPDGLPQTGTNPNSNPDAGENCLGSGWSWNPVSWVMVPVQCALQWAFVPPKTRLDAALDVIQPRLDARGIQPFAAPVLAGVQGLGGSGCSGPAIDLSVVHLPTFYPFSACEEPMSHIATGVSAFFGLSIIIQGGMSCIRGAAAAFGFNWGLGSKSDGDS